ncbi:hypothetical protein Pmani_005152 [Petrolisthes manimaculis]|uniref:Uncharacterized protein n=1 Tax=Petrolisthes manimaculis TaxID=1843537 RepID=A0AAE1QC57_9EUCA|nr:hypothetical protein Pmani_005147 [Petrolisthes manimaculis]KAK4324149.1 hypothetical protein Pmani_005152 [Petrolisthes manimaculis]
MVPFLGLAANHPKLKEDMEAISSAVQGLRVGFRHREVRSGKAFSIQASAMTRDVTTIRPGLFPPVSSDRALSFA